MKNFFIITITAVLIFGIGYFIDSNSLSRPKLTKSNEDQVINVEMSVPSFKFLKMDGTFSQIEDYKGKIVILNFWATWCAPCVTEFPVILDIISKNKDVVFIAISNDNDATEVHKFTQKMRTINAIIDSPQVVIGLDREREISVSSFNVLRLPETFIINRDFKLVQKVIGSDAWLNGTTEKFLATLKR
ncbi:MAG: TlpA disulfide reductase family protein [Bacteriovoracaceae bacterium]